MMGRTLLSILLFVAVLVGLGLHVAEHWSTIDWTFEWDLRGTAAGSLCGAGALVLWVWQMQYLLARQGYRPGFVRCLPLVALPMLAKYVPGKVWGVVMTAHLSGRAGIPPVVGSICAVHSFVYGLVGGVSLSLVGGADFGPARRPVLLLCLAVLVGFLLLLGDALPRWTSRMLRMPALGELVRHSRWDRLLLVLLSIGSWGLYGVGFYLLVAPATALPYSALPQVLVVFVVSHLAGILALFAPGGIGVREAVIVAGFDELLSPGDAIMIAVAGRIWETGVELIFSLAGALVVLNNPPANVVSPTPPDSASPGASD